MTLDELFDVADCYVEEINIYTYSTNIPNPYKNYTANPFPKDWTVTCDYSKDSAADQISSKLNGGIIYDNNSNHTSRSSTR